MTKKSVYFTEERKDVGLCGWSAFRFEEKIGVTSVKEDEPGGGTFEFSGMASTFNNVDFDGDVIVPGAFTDSLARLEARRPADGGLMPVLFSHSMQAPIGVFTELRETELGLEARGVLPMSDTLVAGRIVPQMQVGSIRAMSIGFRILERRFEGDIRVIEKIELFEASLVVFPANPAAQVIDFGNKNNPVDNLVRRVLTLDDFKYYQERELEQMFRNGFPLSGKLAMKVVALLKADQRDADDADDAPRDEAAAQNIERLSDWRDMSARLMAAAKGSPSDTRGTENCR